MPFRGVQHVFEHRERLRRRQLRQHFREVGTGPLDVSNLRPSRKPPFHSGGTEVVVGGNRTRLHDPELRAVVAPFHVLRRSVLPLDREEQRGELLNLRIGQSELRKAVQYTDIVQGRAFRPVRHPAGATKHDNGVALADADFVGIDLTVDERRAKPWRRIHHELVGRSGQRIDRERHAGGDRLNHSLNQHAGRSRGRRKGARTPVCLGPLGIGRRAAREHSVQQIGPSNVQSRVVNAGERLLRRVFRKAGRSNGKPFIGRPVLEPCVPVDRREVGVRRLGQNHEAVGNREAALFQPGAIPGFAANAGSVGGGKVVQCGEPHSAELATKTRKHKTNSPRHRMDDGRVGR